MTVTRSGLYNPLLMATPTGGASLNEEQNLQFNARMTWYNTQNTVQFLSTAESPTVDGPRTFIKIFGDTQTQVSLTPPFKNEFKFQVRLLMTARLRRVRARLITSMPVNTVSLWLWKSSGQRVAGDRVKFIFDFPTPTAPGDEFIFPPAGGDIDFRMDKDAFYYWCFEFDDLIPRTTNFGIELSADVYLGDGLQ